MDTKHYTPPPKSAQVLSLLATAMATEREWGKPALHLFKLAMWWWYIMKPCLCLVLVLHTLTDFAYWWLTAYMWRLPESTYLWGRKQSQSWRPQEPETQACQTRLAASLVACTYSREELIIIYIRVIAHCEITIHSGWLCLQLNNGIIPEFVSESSEFPNRVSIPDSCQWTDG